MRYMIRMVLMIAAVALSGCATDAELRARVATANIEMAKRAPQLLLDAAIPVPGSDRVMTIKVANPDGASRAIHAPQNPWAGVASDALKTVGTVGGIVAGGHAARWLVESTGAGIAGALQHVPDPVQFDQPAPVVVEQPAPAIVEQPSPTVVEQPAPIIVPPTDPVIVTQPDPIIVEPSYPPVGEL